MSFAIGTLASGMAKPTPRPAGGCPYITTASDWSSGETVTAHAGPMSGYDSDMAFTYAYQWFRRTETTGVVDELVAAPDTAAYALAAGDVNNRVACRITVTSSIWGAAVWWTPYSRIIVA